MPSFGFRDYTCEKLYYSLYHHNKRTRKPSNNVSHRRLEHDKREQAL
jgi:hypothetical protein